ncbi:MAG: FtsW/RodA/SpoVE family cell cycle protein, partial [Patescibacteria group bacterium]
PEAQTDFIFAVVAEEMGFVAVVAVLVLYALLVWRAIRLARLATDTFTAHIAAGIAILFTIQITTNVGMNMGLMPVTGIALPFISYGGSSLLFSMIMVGILESIAVRQRSAALTTIDVLERGW